MHSFKNVDLCNCSTSIDVFDLTPHDKRTKKIFNALITPWSIGWVFEVVLGGKNINFIALRLSTLGWIGHLSMTIVTFLHGTSRHAFSHNQKKCQSPSRISFGTCTDKVGFWHLWNIVGFLPSQLPTWIAFH